MVPYMGVRVFVLCAQHREAFCSMRTRYARLCPSYVLFIGFGFSIGAYFRYMDIRRNKRVVLTR